MTQAQALAKTLNAAAKAPNFSYVKARATARKEPTVDVTRSKALNAGFNPDVDGCESFVMLDRSVCEWRAGSFSYVAR